jgi:hypothetical protein
MEPFVVFCAIGVSGNGLIALHKAHNDIEADQDQTLDNAVSGDDPFRIGQGFCRDIRQRSCRGKADLDYCRRNADGNDAPDQAG